MTKNTSVSMCAFASVPVVGSVRLGVSAGQFDSGRRANES